MSIDVIIKRLQESKHLPDGLPIKEVRLSETVILNGSWYWKSKGKCWTQPTNKSKPREEISEEEYREICNKVRDHGGDTPKEETHVDSEEEMMKKMSLEDLRTERDNIKSKLSTAEEYRNEKSIKRFSADLDKYDDEIKSREPQARKDYFDTGNFYHIGRKGDFAKDMEFIKSKDPGVTAELVYGDKSREYARKVAPDKWKTDSRKTLSDNDIASVAYDDGKATINYMVKNNPAPPKKEEEPTPIEKRRSEFHDDSESDYINYNGVSDFDNTSWYIDDQETLIRKNPSGRGYSLEGDIYDEEFDTKGDLVHFLRSHKAEFMEDD